MSISGANSSQIATGSKQDKNRKKIGILVFLKYKEIGKNRRKIGPARTPPTTFPVVFLFFLGFPSPILFLFFSYWTCPPPRTCGPAFPVRPCVIFLFFLGFSYISYVSPIFYCLIPIFLLFFFYFFLIFLLLDLPALPAPAALCHFSIFPRFFLPTFPIFSCLIPIFLLLSYFL